MAPEELKTRMYIAWSGERIELLKEVWAHEKGAKRSQSDLVSSPPNPCPLDEPSSEPLQGRYR